MISIKSEKEIELMRKAGLMVSETHKYLRPFIKPGITTKELDTIAEKFIRENGGIPTCKGYEGFPSALCVSVNEEVVHGIPSNRKLKNGDIVAVKGLKDIELGTYLPSFTNNNLFVSPSLTYRIISKLDANELYKKIESLKVEKQLSKCIGIISYFPDDADAREVRKKRCFELFDSLTKWFKLPVILIAQN